MVTKQGAVVVLMSVKVDSRTVLSRIDFSPLLRIRNQAQVNCLHLGRHSLNYLFVRTQSNDEWKDFTVK